MKVTLYLSRENKLYLIVDTDKFHNNPEWAVDWVLKKKVDSDVRFFRIGGPVRVEEGKQILSFLNKFIKYSDDRFISPEYQPNIIYSKSHLCIVKVASAKKILPQIESLLNKDSITDEDFEAIKHSLQSDAIKECLPKFFAEHTQQFNNDKRKYCGLFSRYRSTQVNGTWTLGEILKHAKEHDNRSRKVCINLGWMNSDGSLTFLAPPLVKNAYPSDERDPLLSVPNL